MQTPKNVAVKVPFEREMGVYDLVNDPIVKAYKQKLRAEVNQIFHLDERFQNRISGEQLCNQIWDILGEGTSCFYALVMSEKDCSFMWREEEQKHLSTESLDTIYVHFLGWNIQCA